VLRLAAALALALQGPACAGPLQREGERLHDARFGGSVQDLASLDPAWQRAKVEGASTAWTGPGDAVMSWTRRCGQKGRTPTLARALLAQLGPSEILDQGPLTFAGASGYWIHARVSNEGAPVDLHLMVRVEAGCVDDWVLLAPGDASSYVALFDRWRGTFVDSPPRGADG
jgi:hypothetical protein